MRTLLECKEALGKEAGGCGGHHTRREDSVKGGSPSSNSHPTSTSTRGPFQGPSASRLVLEQQQGQKRPTVVPGFPSTCQSPAATQRGSGLKMRCRALLTHHQPAPFLSTGAPPRSQTPEVVAFRSPRPDTAASSRGYCKAGSKFPTPRSLSVEPLGSARPPEAQLRTEAAG